MCLLCFHKFTTSWTLVRKTNYDYTKGALPEMIDIICEAKARLFVCAVGVPPRWMVDKLHGAGIPVMNMIGSTRHVERALSAGVDLICAQGYEGGGHTGDVGTLVLIPQEFVFFTRIW